MPTLGLSMIVKNEQSVIINTLKCIIQYLDFISISDTGSNDNTVNTIKTYLNDFNVPYILTEDKWINFSYNRNIALKKLYKKVDYILLIDADEHCTILDQSFKSKLSIDKNICYRVPTKNKGNTLISSKKKIISGYINFKYNGVVHEQVHGDDNYKTYMRLNLLEVVHTRPTSNIKSENYLKLLEQGLELEPLNYSYNFHYGFHFHVTHKYNKAIKIYNNILKNIIVSKNNTLILKYNILKCKYHNKCSYEEIKKDILFFENIKMYEPIYIAILILCREKQYKKAYYVGEKYYKKDFKMNIQCVTYCKDLYFGLFDKKIEWLKKKI